MPESETKRFRDPERDPREAEKAIQALAGVISCRVVASRKGEVIEIHVVATSERHPKQIIRDIETILFNAHEIRVDYQKVSIAQIPPESAEKPAEENLVNACDRLRIIGLSTNLTPEGGAVEVSLRRNSYRGFGRAEFTVAADPMRAVIDATLVAVGRFVEEGTFELVNVQREKLGDREAIIVHVEHVALGRAAPLIGSALIQRDRNLTALHAALDAVNRYIGRLAPTIGVRFVAGPESESD